MKTQASAPPIFPSFRPKSTVLKTALNGFEFPEAAEEPLRPPEFHTGEELNATPPILKSLSPCHGPQTFICVPAQGCQTFVIPQSDAMNGDQEFLSYVIEPKKEDPGEVEKLRTELDKVTLELKDRDEQVDKLTRIRRDGERELEDLTASLFQVRCLPRFFFFFSPHRSFTWNQLGWLANRSHTVYTVRGLEVLC